MSSGQTLKGTRQSSSMPSLKSVRAIAFDDPHNHPARATFASRHYWRANTAARAANYDEEKSKQHASATYQGCDILG